MDWKKKNFLIFGTGISGIAAAELLFEMKSAFTIYEGNADIEIADIRKKSPVLAKTEILTGELNAEVIKRIDVAVLSPGVPVDLPVVKRLIAAGVEIWGEIELAYVAGKGRILAVTGTNGKTTTVTLLGEIMKQAYDDVRVVGNIGFPYTKAVTDTTADTVIVAEISSFQLETIQSFTPQVSAILNITPDHLNRHHTMENYIDAKLRITKNQSTDQLCVLNYEDYVLRTFADTLTIPVMFFSSERELEKGIYLKENDILFSDGTVIHKVCATEELNIIGKHNYENVMAAVAVAWSAGVDLEKIHQVLVHFQAVEHRIEYVATKCGVRYYNDSKGTNPDAAIQAIRAMKWSTLLIGGGYDKDSDYESWICSFEGKVKKLVLLGATREKIAETAVACGYPEKNIVFAESLKEAIKICHTNAESGDAVLLSPACASWGMFRNYEERGNLFKELVKELKE